MNNKPDQFFNTPDNREENVVNNEISDAITAATPEMPKKESSRIAELEQEVANMKDQWMRAMAEAENIRQRSRREREEIQKYANTNFSRDILAIADNLRRALEACPDKEELVPSVQSLVEGVKLIENELLSIFERHNIKKTWPLNEKFDPNLHEAMVQIDDASVPAGTVVQVLQAGYTLHDRTLRAAMVGVSRQPASSTPGATDSSKKVEG